MTTYILFFVIIIVGAGILNRSKQFYLLLACFFLFCLIGFRDAKVGADTIDYISNFYEYSKMNLDRIITEAEESNMESLYIFLSWFVSWIFDSYSAFLCFWALFPVIAIYKVLKIYGGNTLDISISFIVLFMLGLFAFFVSGIRQTAAMSILLLSYSYFDRLKIYNIKNFYKDSDFWKFLLCVILAYSIHKSSILFLIAFPLKDIKVKWWYVVVAGSLFFLAQYIKIDSIVIITRLLFQDRFETYGDSYLSELSMSGYFLQFILFLICYFRRNQLVSKNPQNIMLINMAFLGLCFQSMTGLIGEFFRVSFFFSIFDVILIPRALHEYNSVSNYKMIVTLFVCLSLYYLFFLSSSHLPVYNFA